MYKGSWCLVFEMGLNSGLLGVYETLNLTKIYTPLGTCLLLLQVAVHHLFKSADLDIYGVTFKAYKNQPPRWAEHELHSEMVWGTWAKTWPLKSRSQPNGTFAPQRDNLQQMDCGWSVVSGLWKILNTTGNNSDFVPTIRVSGYLLWWFTFDPCYFVKRSATW